MKLKGLSLIAIAFSVYLATIGVKYVLRNSNPSNLAGSVSVPQVSETSQTKLTTTKLIQRSLKDPTLSVDGWNLRSRPCIDPSCLGDTVVTQRDKVYTLPDTQIIIDQDGYGWIPVFVSLSSGELVQGFLNVNAIESF